MRRTLTYYWRFNLAVLLAAAVATTVLGGALLVGDSVRASLRDLILDRLGRIDYALVAERYADATLAEHLDIEWTEGDLSMKRYTKVTYNHRTQVLHAVFRVEAWRESKKVSEETNDIHSRWFYRYELEHLLARAGYDVVERYGDFDGTPIGEGNELVFVARP